jgi:threonylcarbamoyladenosine tRNA methylthiotransferase MtaB
MFENSLRFISEAGLTYIHAFPYSPRPGTPAARMPQVSKAIARERARLLRAEGEKQIAVLCESRLGRTEKVLMERSGLGRTEQFIGVRVPGMKAGDLAAVAITGCGPDGLMGEKLRIAA